MRSNDFKFFVPVEFEKAKDKAGNEVMKIAGIASTSDKDSDGEVLDPSGFDLSYFMNNGFINWNHRSKDDPATIIGEPTKAEIKDEGLYVEGILYPDSNLAKKVYDLAKGLEKSSTRKLGFSIEGKVIERDSLDEKFVKKAKITGLAITPTPKNHNTICDIIKGEYSDYEDDFETVIGEENKANGGSQIIIDITKPNGDKITVDKNYNIKVISKSTTTENSGNLSPASVDEKLKNLQKSEEENVNIKENNPKFTAINKSILFSELLKATDNDFEKSKLIVNSVNLDTMSKKQITVDELTKALENIGVEVDVDLLKGNKSDMKPEDSEDDEQEEEDEDEIEKAIKEKEAELEMLKSKRKPVEQSDDEDPESDEAIKKEAARLSAEHEKRTKGAEVVYDKEDSKKEDKMEKSFTSMIEKSNQNTNAAISEMKELIKGFAQNVESRLSAMENETPGRKSMGSAKVIEKSFGGPLDKSNEGKTVLSISKNRQQVSNILLAKSGIEKGEMNDFYANAMTSFEATGELSKAVVTDLFANGNILITE